jgi:hypothetical protein
MCDLLFPIFHACYYGLWATPRSAGIPFRVPVVEAIAADCFVRFLSRPPVAYLGLFERGTPIQRVVATLERILGSFRLGHIARIIVETDVFQSWTSALFAMDLSACKLILVWEWLFVQTPRRGFADAFCALVAQMIVDARDHCLDGDTSDLLALLEDLSGLDVRRVLECAANL